MPYCAKCGVKLSSEYQKCPLCSFQLPKLREEEQTEDFFPVERKNQFKSYKILPGERRMLIWIVCTAVILIPLAVLLLLNFFLDSDLSWSLYAVNSLLALWSYLSLFIFSRKRLILLFLGTFLCSLLLLFSLDSVDTQIQWFFPLALPIVSCLFLCILVNFLIIYHGKYFGFNIAGWIFLFLTLLCFVIDLSISYYLTKEFTLYWSVITFIVFIILAAFFFIIHYWLKRKVDFAAFFHTQ